MEKSDYVSMLLFNIEKICSSSNLPATYVETESGVGKGLINNLKKGSIPSADKVAKLADFLGVSTDYLLGRTDNPHETELPMGDNNIIIGRDNSGTATVNNTPVPELTLGEMETELLKAFQSLPFTEKIDVLNYIINKAD